MFKEEGVKSWDGQSNWVASSIKSMLQNEKYMGDVILQKSYTKDFLTKKRVANEGQLQKFHIQNDHEPIIDREIWDAAQQEMERRERFCKEYHINAYAQRTKENPFSGKIICGECGHTYTRVVFRDRSGNRTDKWRCASVNKAWRRVCSNRYVLEEAFQKLFTMSWNDIVENKTEYEEKWNRNIESEDELLRYKTRLIIAEINKGAIAEFDPRLMIKVMDRIAVYENGCLKIRFYDGTEFACETGA